MLKDNEMAAITTQGSITNHLLRAEELRRRFYGLAKDLKASILFIKPHSGFARRTRVGQGSVNARYLFNLNSSCGSFLVALGESDFENPVLVRGFRGSWIDQVGEFELLEITPLS